MNDVRQAVELAIQENDIRKVMNKASSCIHEDDYKELNCVLCNKVMKTIHDTHNAFPLAKLQSAKEAFENPENHSRCCSECDRDVYIERIKMMSKGRKNNKSNRPIGKPGEYKILSIKELQELTSIYETPQAQKRFKELGQNYYETGLGRRELKRRNDESSFSTKKGE